MNDATVKPADLLIARSHGDLAFALLQMETETRTRIDEAVVRLDAGKCRSCFTCGGDIAEQRLQALPFAVRCQACEERREHELGYARQLAQRRVARSLGKERVLFRVQSEIPERRRVTRTSE